MKTIIKQYIPNKLLCGALGLALFALGNSGYAQDTPPPVAAPVVAPVAPPDAVPAATEKVAKDYVKNTFAGNLLIDNQTVMVATKNTFEFAIQHRFGTINNGYSDFAGLFAPSNIRLGFAYTPISNLQLGFGITKVSMLWDGNAKLALCKQSKTGGCPVSVTYYGNFAVSTLPKAGNFVSDMDRLSYFHQLIIARKVTTALSVQVSPSLSYFNNIAGYMSSDGTIKPLMNNAHYAIAFGGRYKLNDGVAVIANYDQPLTQHPSNNPHPNISFGFDLGTTGHSFQIFVGNYQSINQQANNVFNQNDFTASRYCIGFNIVRKWYDFFGSK